MFQVIRSTNRLQRLEVRVELWLQRSDAKENKWLFDRLGQQRAEIEARFGERLRWLRLDKKKASRITFSRSFDGFNESNWPDMVDWLREHIVRLEKAFSEPLAQLNQQFKSGIDNATANGASHVDRSASD